MERLSSSSSSSSNASSISSVPTVFQRINDPLDYTFIEPRAVYRGNRFEDLDNEPNISTHRGNRFEDLDNEPNISTYRGERFEDLDNETRYYLSVMGIRGGLSDEISYRIANHYKEILITSMIAGTGSLLLLSLIIGTSSMIAYRTKAIARVNELRKRELEKFSTRTKSINAKFEKVLNGTYKSK